jgi:multicomponent Na+:H+ antiporter subunit C
MNTAFLFALVGVGLFSLGLYALIVHVHLLRKILALNVMGSGIFLVLVALARRTGEAQLDAVPDAMVITGIVVAISVTVLALTLMLRLVENTGRAEIHDDKGEPRI